VAFTGEFSRPYFHSGLGVDFQITRAFTFGPLIGYGHVFQNNGPRYSSDARSVELCGTLTFRPVADEPPPRSVTYVFRDRVVEMPPPPAPPSGELDKLIDEAFPVPKAPKASVELLAPVLFKFASDELEPVGVAMLHEVSRELKKRQDIRLIEIQGYADSRGSDELNIELSNRRAQRVLEWLVAHGVEPERLRVAARGEAAPVEEAAETEEAHEQNRRVVFRVIEAVEEVDPATQDTAPAPEPVPAPVPSDTVAP
jgi:outer membrane protein OmpA-like peptidoglycan-associated protein